MDRLSRKQALYLYRKFNNGDISDRMLQRMLGVSLYVDLTAGWFVDFYIDELMEDLYA